MASRNMLILKVIEEILDEGRAKVQINTDRIKEAHRLKKLASPPLKKTAAAWEACRADIELEKKKHATVMAKLNELQASLERDLLKLGVEGRSLWVDHEKRIELVVVGPCKEAVDYQNEKLTKIRQIQREAQLAVASARAPELLAISMMAKEAIDAL
jgi:hypothetical protein